MNPFLKLLLEFGPLLIFFAGYRFAGGDLIVATAVFMAAIFTSLGISLAVTRRAPRMMLVTAVVVLVFGGLTLWLEDATFIKMKPTIVNALFALALGIGIFRGRSYLQLLMEEAISLDAHGWRRLTVRWAWFFVAMAVLNEVVWRTQSEETWVTVKTFGYLPVALAFALLQLPLIQRHQT